MPNLHSPLRFRLEGRRRVAESHGSNAVTGGSCELDNQSYELHMRGKICCYQGRNHPCCPCFNGGRFQGGRGRRKLLASRSVREPRGNATAAGLVSVDDLLSHHGI